MNHPIPPEYKDMKIQPLGNIHQRYMQYINGCRTTYTKYINRCEDNDIQRWEMSLKQPQSMKNYTTMGYTKIRAPTKVFTLLKSFKQT